MANISDIEHLTLNELIDRQNEREPDKTQVDHCNDNIEVLRWRIAYYERRIAKYREKIELYEVVRDKIV